MKKAITIISLLIIVFAFIKYGRSIYMPGINKIKGKETVQSRILTIEKNAKERLEQSLNNAGFREGYPEKIILVGFKEEQVLQVYANDSNGIQFVKEYPFTAFSGKFGPKLKEGDKQIPEGIYEVEYLNPNSSYYLSIKINYPNEFDISKSKYSKKSDLGSDIFIHGKSATIGCIPIGDEAIEEVFLLTQKAINNKVKVIISPRDFRTHPTYPDITAIDWEKELYSIIDNELFQLELFEQ